MLIFLINRILTIKVINNIVYCYDQLNTKEMIVFSTSLL